MLNVGGVPTGANGWDEKDAAFWGKASDSGFIAVALSGPLPRPVRKEEGDLDGSSSLRFNSWVALVLKSSSIAKTSVLTVSAAGIINILSLRPGSFEWLVP